MSVDADSIMTAGQLITGVVLIRMGVARWRAGGWSVILLGLMSVWQAAWTRFPGTYTTLRLVVVEVVAGALLTALVVKRRDLWRQMRVFLLLASAALAVPPLWVFAIPEGSTLEILGLPTAVLFYLAAYVSFCIQVLPRLVAGTRAPVA